MAGSDFGSVVVKRTARKCAFNLEAYVEKNLIRGNGDDLAFELLAGLRMMRVRLLKLGEKIAEVFRGVCDEFGGRFCGGLRRGDGLVFGSVFLCHNEFPSIVSRRRERGVAASSGKR